ncbi:hypothetical protein LMG27177_06818 [Paraburkholderia fynbosensis]|uniref:Uncharacterized protein n=1 Tax=Paraburkholderia fynbosensis TaxID=1200993 RepID=A0A6J5H0C5_9BURK|nr:hypothetical protein LMG27177_06818 [Paraburkholderia fynbosensis]
MLINPGNGPLPCKPYRLVFVDEISVKLHVMHIFATGRANRSTRKFNSCVTDNCVVLNSSRQMNDTASMLELHDEVPFAFVLASNPQSSFRFRDVSYV